MKTEATRSINVLLVEDEPIVQKVHTSILEKLGCKVDLAINAEQALMKANNDYDIIFMDIGLPGKSGIEITVEIRTNEIGRKNVPIIVLTAYSNQEIKQQCLMAKANVVYTKPININILKQILQDYVVTKT